MSDFVTYFITWTTYGTWLPGDARGWRKSKKGNQPAQPLLESWCRNQLTAKPVLLNQVQRDKVEAVCRTHAEIRSWILHAVNARSNHVHLAVTADKKPETVREQFKANATRVLRQEPDAISHENVWSRGGDCEVVNDDDNLARIMEYIMEAQDQMNRGK